MAENTLTTMAVPFPTTTSTTITITTTTPTTPPGYVYVAPPQWATVVGYTLSALELPFHATVIAVALLNTAVLWRTAVLHPNLRVLLIGQSVTIVFYELGRLGIVAQKFVVGNIFVRLQIEF
jgi:hypothetical protein